MHRVAYTNGRRASSVDDDNPYWVSFSDIMAGLLVVFILSLIVLMLRLNQQTIMKEELREKVEAALAELYQIEELRKEILHEIQDNLRLSNVDVEVVDNHSVLRIPEEQLSFKSSRYDIPEGKRNTVSIIGEMVRRALIKPGRTEFIDTIFIEGHTDSVPYGSVEFGNWGLSAHRAISIWKYWTEDPGRLRVFTKMKNKDGRNLFSVSGYSWTRRIVVPDVLPEDRQKNRRIDIRFTMRTPVTGDLQELLDRLKE